MSSIDKLALTCRLLYDQRVLEQRKEIEKLEVKLLLKNFTRGQLKKVMADLNSQNIRCKCLGCQSAGRFYNPDRLDMTESVCTFGPWFDNFLQECGFGVHCYEKGQKTFEMIPFTDDDCHMVDGTRGCILTSHLVRWDNIRIGKRLWNAESINDQCIKQFVRVFGVPGTPLSSPPMPPLPPKMAPPPPPPLPITTTINQGLELQALKEQLATKDLELLALKAQLATQAAEMQTLQLDYVRDDTDNKRKRP
jgi:hypothetical protein